MRQVKEVELARFLIRLLGPFEVRVEGEPISGFHSDKVRALLAYLCVEAEKPHRRQRLAGLLWPDLPESSARTNLRHALADLRGVISERAESERHGARIDFLHATRQTIQFNIDSDIWVDTLDFLATVGKTQAPITELEEAMTWYRGELLEGFSLPDSSLFEEWLLLQRERFQRLALDTLGQLARDYALRGSYEKALEHAWRQVDLDPLRETAHRQVMRLMAYTGHTSEALAQFETYRVLLSKELGTEPLAETSRLAEEIREGRLPIPAPFSVYLPGFLTDETQTLAEQPIFVAREEELRCLGRFLDQAHGGRGGVALVVGQAGTGKTALLREFGRRSRRAHPDLLIAGGKGNANTNAGDPYFPFHQAMELLMGDVEGVWRAGTIDRSQALQFWGFLPTAIRVLIETGPDLIGPFVSGRQLLGRARAFHQSSGEVAPAWVSSLEALVGPRAVMPASSNMQQRDLFEQVTRVLRKLAQPAGLLLMLDDFQWADAGSIGLLFHLGRQLAGSRILIAVAYRSEDVSIRYLTPDVRRERHPLMPVINQLEREYGDIHVNLDQSDGRQFVEAFLDSKPYCLEMEFRDRLYELTEGQALYTVELLHAMQERGDLVPNRNGRWIEGPAVDWNALPARVGAVIAERVERVDMLLREILRVASVMGEEFTAEIVADVQKMDKEKLLHRLSRELDRQHRLVAASRIQRINDQPLSVYRFRHILFQKYLYQELDDVERARLHGEVGRTLEELCEDHQAAKDELAPLLAHHFERAGLIDKAVVYLQQAGERAARLWANEEAIRHLNAGLALLQTLPETPERDQQELSMQLALAAPLQAVKGYAAPETGRAYARARELVLKVDVGETFDKMHVFGLLAGYYHMRAEHEKSFELYERSEETARRLGYQQLAATGRAGKGSVLMMTGQFSQALTYLKEMTDLYDPQQRLTLIIGQDIVSSAHAGAALILWLLGFPDQALDYSQMALSLAEASQHPFSQCFVRLHAGLRLHLFRREHAQVRHRWRPRNVSLISKLLR
jgi:DNA-binding SARP family transcriptional activator